MLDNLVFIYYIYGVINTMTNNTKLNVICQYLFSNGSRKWKIISSNG